jgi:hypothetical protein
MSGERLIKTGRHTIIAEMEAGDFWASTDNLGLPIEVVYRIKHHHPTPEDLQMAEAHIIAAREFLVGAEVGVRRPS